MKDKNSISKNDKLIKKSKAKTKSKISYKQKYNDILTKFQNLEINLMEQKRQNQINIDDFHKKAESFQTKAQQEIDKFREKLKQETQQEKDNIKKYGSQKMFESSLEILLNIELAILAGEKNKHVANYVQGFKMLINQLYDNLENYEIKKISPKIDEDFNSKLHSIIETKKGNKNKIIEVKREGFMLYDRVIKPAVVVIGQ